MATAKKLPSGNYRIRVYDKETGKYKSFTAETKRKAEKLAADWLNTSRYAHPKDREVTVRDVIQRYINERTAVLSPASIHKYNQILNSQLSENFTNTAINSLKESDVLFEVNRLSKHYQPKTVKNAICFIVPIIRKCRRDLDLDISTPKVFQKQKIYPAADEIMKLFKGSKIELEVLLALCCGLRKEEIRGLKHTDIKGNTMYIRRVKIDVGKETIVRENAAKTLNSIRKIELPPFILDLIKQRQGTEYITELSGHAIYMRFYRVTRKAGYDISFHDLRHINASIMLFLGIPDKYAMERGGWATDSTLKSVYQSTFEAQRRQFDKVIDNHFISIYDTLI